MGDTDSKRCNPYSASRLQKGSRIWRAVTVGMPMPRRAAAPRNFLIPRRRLLRFLQ